MTSHESRSISLPSVAQSEGGFYFSQTKRWSTLIVSMNFVSLFFTMAAIGIAETAYLIRERYASRKPICPMGGGCSQVLESRYNKTLGVYNDFLGLTFYTIMAVLCAFLLLEVTPTGWWNQIIVVATGVALLMSARFFYLQWRVIHAWCFWCLLSALTILLMSLILLLSGLSLSL